MSNEMLRLLLLSNREKAFEQLYEQAFPVVARFINSKGGDFSDAKDIFQDALIIFYEKIVGENVTFKVSASAYVLGIAKHLWHRKFRKQHAHLSLNEMEKEIVIPEDMYGQADRSKQLFKYLEMAGKKCMDMLQGFYYQHMSMQEIAHTFGYSSVRSATVQKYKCLEKVRKSVKSADHEEIFA